MTYRVLESAEKLRTFGSERVIEWMQVNDVDLMYMYMYMYVHVYTYFSKLLKLKKSF